MGVPSKELPTPSESHSDSEDEFSDSEEGSEWESVTDTDSDDDIQKPHGSKSKLCIQSSSSSSSESDQEAEQCPICLLRIVDQDVGTPESCDHNFCLECIQEWAKNTNQCPMDRLVFKMIFARHGVEGVIYKKIEVEDRQIPEHDEDEFAEGCEICGRHDNEEWMLLCDGCDLGFHCQCLTPALDSIPVGDWFCTNCRPHVPLDEPTPGPSVESTQRNGRQCRDCRLIGRTRVSERVRAAIASVRATRGRRIIVSASESSDDYDSEYDSESNDYSGMDLALAGTVEFDPDNPPPKAPPRPRSTKPRKRKSTSKRKSKKSKSTSMTHSTSSKRRAKTKGGRKRRRVKRRKKKMKKRCKDTGKVYARTKRQAPTTCKMRIADALGLASPPVGSTIPRVRGSRSEQGNGFMSSRQDNVLSLLGEGSTLVAINDSDDESMMSAQVSQSRGGGVATMRPAAQVMSDAIAIHRRSKHKLALSHSAPLISVQCPPCSTDLLGDILNDQNVLHRSNSDGIVIDDTNKPKVSVKDKNLINGRQCIGIGNGEQPNGNAKYTGPPASNSTNTTASPTEELNTPEHITAENQSLQGFDQGGEESGDDNAYFSPIESSEEENDDKETKDSDDKNDNSNRMPLQFDIGSLEPIESEEDSIKSSPMKPANDTGHDTSLDTATDTLEDSAQEAGNKEAEETTDYNPCSPTLDEPQYNPFSPTQESQDSGKHSDQESTNQNDKHNSSKDSDDESIKNKTVHDSAESDSDSENDSKKKRRIKRTSKDSDSEPIDTSILRRYSDTDSDSIPSKKAISDSEFSDTEPEDNEPQVDEEKRVDSEDYFTVQPTQQLRPSPEPNGLNTSTAPTFDSGDETPTEDEIPLPAGTDERIVVRGTIGGTTSLGHLPTSDTSGALPGMLDIPLPSTATIPLPDADDADIIPMPDCDIPAIRPGAPVRLTAAGIAVQNAVQNAAVSSRAEPIVVEDTEQTTTGDGGDIFDLTGPDNFINIEPSGQNYIEIIPIEDAGEGSNNTSNVTSNGTEQDKDHSDSDNNARPSRGDAFGRLGPIPNADAATKDQQSLLFAQREHPSFELEDGEQRSDLESPLQVTAPAVVEKVKFKKRKRKKHDRRSETPESDYHVDKSSSRKKDRRKEKERSLDREIEREREKERKKKKRDREREVRAEWGEYEQVSADDLELSLTSANKKRKKNKKKDRESEKENWMIEVDKYEEYRNKTRREKEKNIDKEFDAREYANKVYRYDNGGEWAATSDAEADHPRGRKSKKQRQRERRVTETSVKEREKSENRSRERIHKSRRSRTRSPVRRRDKSKRSYSRSRSRGRDRSSRARSPDRRRNKRSPRRQDRSRTREAREVRLASVDRDRRGRRNRDDRISPEPRKHSKKRRSYSRSPARKERRRSKNRSKSPKRDKEYYRERDRDDYRGSLALFAQSLKEVTEPQKASNRRVKMSKKHPDRLEVDVEQAVNRKSSDRNDRRRHRYSSEKDQRSDGDEVTIVAVKEAPARKKKKRHGKSTSGGNASKQTESSKTTTSLAASLSKSGRARVDSSPETTRPTLTGEPVDAPRRGFQPLDLPTRARTPPAARAASPAARSPPSDTYDPSRPTEEASPISTHSPIKRTPPRRKRQRKTNPDDIFRNLTPPSSGTDGDDDMVHRKGDKPLQPLLPPILQEEILMRHHRPIDGSRGTTAPSSTSASTVTSHGAASVNGVIPSSSQTLGATHRLPQFVPVSHHPPPARIGWPLSRPDTVLTSPGSSTTPLGINVSAGTGLQAPSSTELLPSAAKPSPSKQSEHITTDTSQQKDPVIARKSPQILSGLSALSAAPPPLPVKALKEMEQISQLLNAQAKLSSLLSSVQTEKKITVGTRKHKSTVPKEKLDDAVLDAASPRSDDGMALTSFSPPPISPAHRRAQAQSHSKTPVKHHKPPPASGAETGKEDDITSAVALDHKEKYLKKLNRQERVIEEVKLAVKPFYSRHVITKEEYKDIMRRAVPKICHSKGGDINGAKIRALVEAYVDRVTKSRKPNRHKKTNKPSISSVFAPKKATPAK